MIHSITTLALIQILLNNLTNLIFHRTHTESKLLLLNLQLLFCFLSQIKHIIILARALHLFLLKLTPLQIPIIVLLYSIIITQIFITSIYINTLVTTWKYQCILLLILKDLIILILKNLVLKLAIICDLFILWIYILLRKTLIIDILLLF